MAIRASSKISHSVASPFCHPHLPTMDPTLDTDAPKTEFTQPPHTPQSTPTCRAKPSPSRVGQRMVHTTLFWPDESPGGDKTSSPGGRTSSPPSLLVTRQGMTFHSPHLSPHKHHKPPHSRYQFRICIFPPSRSHSPDWLQGPYFSTK